MNAQQILNKQVQELFKSNFDIKGLLKMNVETAIRSGAIDTESIKPDDMTTAKAIFSITLANAARQYIPISDEGKKDFKNLQNFI